jgi:hypothetical protein
MYIICTFLQTPELILAMFFKWVLFMYTFSTLEWGGDPGGLLVMTSPRSNSVVGTGSYFLDSCIVLKCCSTWISVTYVMDLVKLHHSR